MLFLVICDTAPETEGCCACKTCNMFQRLSAEQRMTNISLFLLRTETRCLDDVGLDKCVSIVNATSFDFVSVSTGKLAHLAHVGPCCVSFGQGFLCSRASAFVTLSWTSLLALSPSLPRSDGFQMSVALVVLNQAVFFPPHVFSSGQLTMAISFSPSSMAHHQVSCPHTTPHPPLSDLFSASAVMEDPLVQPSLIQLPYRLHMIKT